MRCHNNLTVKLPIDDSTRTPLPSTAPSQKREAPSMWDDDDDEDEEAGEADDDDLTVPCPQCHEPVYEDAEQCPKCGTYLSTEDRPWSRPTWLIVGVAICLGIVAYWNFRMR